MNKVLHCDCGFEARAADEKELVTEVLHSPNSTYFYKIHGLVNTWWAGYEKFPTGALLRYEDLTAQGTAGHSDPVMIGGSSWDDFKS